MTVLKEKPKTKGTEMTQEVPELPPLPEPTERSEQGHDLPPCNYTADQMRAYAREAITQAVADAQRYRWLLQYLHVNRDEPDSWTCWIGLDLLAFRSKTTDPTELLDALMARFPIDEAMRQGAQQEPPPIKETR
jgi:hypothetical protein